MHHKNHTASTALYKEIINRRYINVDTEKVELMIICFILLIDILGTFPSLSVVPIACSYIAYSSKHHTCHHCSIYWITITVSPSSLKILPLIVLRTNLTHMLQYKWIISLFPKNFSLQYIILPSRYIFMYKSYCLGHWKTHIYRICLSFGITFINTSSDEMLRTRLSYRKSKNSSTDQLSYTQLIIPPPQQLPQMGFLH